MNGPGPCRVVSSPAPLIALARVLRLLSLAAVSTIFFAVAGLELSEELHAVTQEQEATATGRNDKTLRIFFTKYVQCLTSGLG